MKTFRLALAAFALMLVAGLSTAYAQVAVIANKNVSAAKADISQLKNLFMLDSKDFGGAKIVIIDFKDNNASKEKLAKALGSTPEDMRKAWLRAKLTGNGTPPKTVGSPEDMVKEVASTPGAIGYVPADKVTGDVKVLYTIP